MNLFKYTYDLVRQIPPGRVSTYGAVAEALGDKRAARAVGWMMNQNPDPDDMPCFKIVYADGSLGGFGGNVEDKIRRLHNDNIMISQGKIVDFDQVFFQDFSTNFPLKHLQEEQHRAASKIILEDGFSTIDSVAGFDVAYPPNEFTEACAACVVMEYPSQRIIEEKVIFDIPDFPYIPSYLSYRELPLLQKVISSLKTTPTLAFFDGHGILHPRCCGLASHAGISFDMPSIGVGKSLLTGSVQKEKVFIDAQHCGYAVVFSRNAKKPIFISPGNKVSLPTTYDIIKTLCSFKSPEPLRYAHHLATSSLCSHREILA